MRKVKLLLPMFLLLLLSIMLFACGNGALTHVAAKNATCEEDGYTEYWYQESTGKYFADAAGQTEITRESTVIAATGHRYGSWRKGTNPTTASSGTLIRICANDSQHTMSTVIPPLDAKNGYTVTDNDGEETVTLPTFESEGEAFYVYRISNQVFVYSASLPNLEDYYNDRDDAILVPIEDVTYTGAATYDAASKTILIKNSADTASFTVNADRAGFYSVYLKYANKNNLRTMLSIYNDSYTDWTGYTHSNLAGSEKTSDMIYTLRENELLADFPDTECAVVYLKEGENDLRFIFNREIGFSDILFVENLIFEDTVSALYPYSGVKDAENGYKLNDTDSVEIQITVPQDGTYALHAMLSTTGGTLTIDSKTGSFPMLLVDQASKTGNSGLSSADHIASTYLSEIGSLQLKAGTHTLRITFSSPDHKDTDFFHFNYLALVRTGDMKAEESLSVDFSKVLTPEIHSLTLKAVVSGLSPKDQAQNMIVAFEGYYTHEDGSETPFSQEFTKTAYDQTFRFNTTPLSGNMDGVSYFVKIYNADKTEILYTGRLYHYSIRDTLTVFMITDLHHCGSNLTQEIRNYKYAETHQWGWSEVVLKTRNSNSTACDIYGWSTDDKVQRVMDDVIRRYEAGEFDIAFFLGDSSMNDGNYYNFATDHIMYPNQSHYGESIDDFWDSPLNLDLLMLEQYFSQLSDAGIPFYTANGNHDYSIDYSDDKLSVDYSARERMYHYQELFGHKNASGHIYDATPTNFFIRVIRRDGEVKILSALSTEELNAFKLRYANDANCYDFYVSEDTLSDSDMKLGAFMMVDTYQIDSLDYYMRYYVYSKDPITGEANTSVKDYHGQTIRSDYHNMDVIEEMTPMVEEFSSVYMVSHNHCSDIGEYIAEHENIVGWFFGDLHEMSVNNTRFMGLVQQWVCGQFACGFDVKYYFERNPETGEKTGVADNQYKDGSSIKGSYENIPFSYGMLHIKGDEAYYVREDISYFYQNTEPQYNIMLDRVVGWDPMYERAVDYTHEGGTTFQVGDRTVFVGNDTYKVGSTHIQIARTYTHGKYNIPEFMLSPTETALVYTVCDTAGRALNANGQPVVASGGTALTVTLSSTTEGTTLTLFGETYYTISKSGGAVGHYLYDENGDFVYVDQNGNYVFYDFYKDADGNFMMEYFFEDENGNFVPLGYWNDDHTKYTLYDGTYTHLSGTYVDENGVTKTTAGIWLNGDTMTVSRIDSTTGDAGLVNKVITQFRGGKFAVATAELKIQNGVVVRGEGFMHKSYTYRFVDAYGNEIDKSTVKRTQKETYTYTLRDRENYKPGDTLSSTSFNRVANGLSDIYGLYVPYIEYEKDWLKR